ncbi:hypothetical protein E0K89_019865, partial [Aquicoccus sp. SCR17]|nr:hypothetical protein [Carideicomes alvinocaridis]
LAGALGPEGGWLFSAGTGSFAGSRRGAETRLLGGWGLNLGDQGSGAWLGRRALEAALLTHDCILHPGPLSALLLEEFGNDPLALVAFSRTAGSADYARFAPQVVDLAGDDAVARNLMEEGAAYVAAALDSLGYAAGGRLCLTGGLGPSYLPFLPKGMRGAVVAPEGTPLDGALALASGPA